MAGRLEEHARSSEARLGLDEVLQRAGDAAAEGSSGRIEPHHIRMAVRGDDDLARLVGPAALEQGGLLRPDAEQQQAEGG